MRPRQRKAIERDGGKRIKENSDAEWIMRDTGRKAERRRDTGSTVRARTQEDGNRDTL